MATELELYRTRIEDIIIDSETQVRLDLFLGMEELAADIKANGLIHPPTLRRDADGLHLVEGRRRVEACKTLGWKEIPYQLTEKSKKDAIHVTIAENLARNNLRPDEEAKLFKAAIDLGWKEHELATKHGKTSQYIQDRLALLQTAPKVQELVHKGELGVETVKRAIADKPREIQETIARQIKEEGADLRESQRIANRIDQEYKRQQKFKEDVAQSKFKTCPTCKKPAQPRPEFHEPSNGWAQCREEMYELEADREKHIWNLKTGQTLAEKAAEERKAAVEKRRPKGGPAIVTRAFRYNVPVEVLQKSILAEAVAVALKRLRQGTRRVITVQIDDDFNISVEMLGDNLTFDLDDGAKFNKSLALYGDAFLEPKKYGDKGGNVTKVSPSHTSNNQDTINARNAKFRKWLDSLPEVAKYKKTHKLK